MWKSIAVIGIIIVFASCGSKKTATEISKNSNRTKESKEIVLGKNQAVTYKSLGNGVASILLELYENDTFKFDFKIIPQPESDDKPTKISEKGTYTSAGNWKTLTFKNPEFSLSAIFDEDFTGSADFQVIDKETVKINTSKNTLNIWGVICEKQ